MAQNPVNVGTSANDGTGDSARAAFQKINADIAALYAGAAASSSPVQIQQYLNTGSSTFTVPDGIYLIYLSGCGGGGGGAGGYTGSGATGGGGGGPAPQFHMLPVAVTPGSILDVFVGSKGSGGAIGSDGTDGTESYISGSGILSPFKNTSNQILMGYGLKGAVGSSTVGGQGGGAMMASTASAVYGTLTTSSGTGQGHSSRWWYTDGQIAIGILHPICQGSGGGGWNGSTGGNGGSRNTAGFQSMNGRGLGAVYLGTAAGGAGGAGGGGGYALGGDGGDPDGSPLATSGFGYGGGGGGGASNQAGADGTDGFIEIAY